VISPEPQPQPPSTRSVLLRAEEVPSVVIEMRMPTTPPPPAPAAAVEEGEAATKATVTRAALETSSGAGPSVEGVVVVLDEDAAPPPASERHDAVVVLTLESAQVPAATSHLPAVEVSGPPLTMEVQGPPPTAEVAESSSARVSLTVEEMMDLEMCQNIDLPGAISKRPGFPRRNTTRRRSGGPTSRQSWKRSHRSRRHCRSTSTPVALPQPLRRHGGRGPSQCRGSRGADRRHDRVAACR
jgi:hypothetical protein